MMLNVGCQHKKLEGFVNVDLNPLCMPDLVADACDIPLPSESVYCIESTHCIEHVSDFMGFMSEMHRLLSSDGILTLTMPYAYGRIALGYDHVRHFKARDFYQFEQGNKHKIFNPNIQFKVLSVFYRHKYPFYLFPLWFLGYSVQIPLNLLGKRFRESYECQWGWLFPMVEFTIILKKEVI